MTDTKTEISKEELMERFISKLNPSEQKFMKTLREFKKHPIKVADFEDDKIPMFDSSSQELQNALNNKNIPKGIKTDDEMDSAWRFVLLACSQGGFSLDSTPLELVTLFRATKLAEITVKKLDGLKRRRQNLKSERNKLSRTSPDRKKYEDDIAALDVEINTKEKELVGACPKLSQIQRRILVDIMCVIGFLKEYIMLRKARLELAETQVVYVPISTEEPMNIIIENNGNAIVKFKGNTEYKFYRDAKIALDNNPNTKEFVTIMKNKFDNSVRIGDDRIDYIVVKFNEDKEILLETDPISAEVLKSNIKADPLVHEESTIDTTEKSSEEVLIPTEEGIVNKPVNLSSSVDAEVVQ